MTKKIGKKGLIIILGGILTLLIVPGIAAGALVQGQTLQNGTLWITTYQTPTGTQYPQPFDSFHANNLVIEIYSPLTNVQNASITVKSYTASDNLTEYENQSFIILPRQVQSISVEIPKSPNWQLISLTWDNDTVSYYVQTYSPAQFPFGNSILGMLALIGIVMLAFTALNIALTKGILNKTKYFPKLSQRAWLALIILTGIVIYTITTEYYYSLTGQDWEIWLIPLWFFNFLMILSAWTDNSELTLFLHIHETQGHDLETGLYVVRTAKMSEKELSKYHLPNPAEEEYIDSRSYVDFAKRLIGHRIPILMDSAEHPDQMHNVQSKEPSTKRKRKPWAMRDRKGKEHPFSKAYLIDPKSPSPQITTISEPRGKNRKGEEKSRTLTVLQSHLNGKHMIEAEYFLSDYTTASESGKEIHRLSLDLANNQSQLNTKAYGFQKELIDQLFKIQDMRSEPTNGNIRTNPVLEREQTAPKPETPTLPEKKEEEKK